MADLSWMTDEQLLALRDAMGVRPTPRPAKAVAVQPREVATASADNWQAGLVFNAQGMLKPKATINFRLYIAKYMPGVFAWNDFHNTLFMIHPPPWKKNGTWRPRPVDDNDISEVCNFLETKGMSPRPNDAIAMVTMVAIETRFHPIKDYLARLTWDGIPRLAGGMWEGETMPHFPAEYMGTPEDKIYGAFFRRWMISAVARVMEPGCKADCMIVLEGAQGTMKSTMLRVLATIDGVEYFTDSIYDIEHKDASIQLQGVWIGEVAELNAFQKKESDAIKSWLSRTTDRHRPLYGRMSVDFPRQYVIAGTLNPTDGFLRDATGARRFWPIPVKEKIDIPRIAADRDQLWAEAMASYRDDVQWFLTDEEVAAAKGVTDERWDEEPLGAAIEHFVQAQATTFETDDVYRALGLSNKDKTKAVSNRICAYLRHRGYMRTRGKKDGDRQPWIWSKS
jgi:predicted P-loop ATPase